MSEISSKLQKTQQDFKNFYDTQLREEYTKLELSRQKYLKMFWRNLIILVLFLIFTSFIYKNHLLMLALSKIKGDLLIYLWGGLLAFMVVFCIAPFVLYERETKSATKDLFETSALFTPALSYKKVSEVIGQLYSIFAVIDIVKKNTNFMTTKKQTEKRKFMVKNLYVFRHGETDLNKEGRLQGQSNNPPLNADGLEQAKNLAAQFADIKLDVVYTSPLNRAYQTGAMVAQSKKVPLIVDERLIEGNFGIAEGMLKTDIQKQFAEEYKNGAILRIWTTLLKAAKANCKS